MTVSRALRNQPRISESMRKQIHEKALELGYRPDPMLSALAHYRQGRGAPPVNAAIAWLNRWPDPAQLRAYQEFDLYWEGARKAAQKLGFHLEEFVVTEQMNPQRLATILLTRNVRGILLPPGPFAEGWAETFPWEKFSVVSLGRNVSALPVHIVTSDQSANTMLAFGALRQKGYERIGFVGRNWQPRLFGAGFLWAQMGISEELRVPPLLFRSEDYATSEQAFISWFNANKPDAILTEISTLPQMLANSACQKTEEVGLAAMSIVDCPIDAGIFQNSEEIGRVSVLMLNSLINDNAKGIPPISREVLIKGRWVDGKSLPRRLAGDRRVAL
ncbi:MAG: LacI family DNA-binding transcriptional regulator [Verrucomicrobia bacterium]|nr:LacI family DNA-binding transcriptional regulator [Verrucomicrobiota bacterium]